MNATPRQVQQEGWNLADLLERFSEKGIQSLTPEQANALYLYAVAAIRDAQSDSVNPLAAALRRDLGRWASDLGENIPAYQALPQPFQKLADDIGKQAWGQSGDVTNKETRTAFENVKRPSNDKYFGGPFTTLILTPGGVPIRGRALPLTPTSTPPPSDGSVSTRDLQLDNQPPAAGSSPASPPPPPAGPAANARAAAAPSASGASWSMPAALGKYFPQGFQPGQANGPEQAEEIRALFLYALKQNNPLALAMRREFGAWAKDYLAKTPNGPFKELAGQIAGTKWYEGNGTRTVSDVCSELLQAGPENKADWDFHLPRMNVRFDGTFDYKTPNKQVTGPSATPAPDPSPAPVYRLTDYDRNINITPDGSNAHATDPDFAPRPRGGEDPADATNGECNTSHHRSPGHHIDPREFTDSMEQFRQFYQDRPDLFPAPPAPAQTPAEAAAAPAPAQATPAPDQTAPAPTRIPPAAHDASATEKDDLIAIYGAMRLRLGEFGVASTKSPEQLKNATASEIRNELQGIYRKLAEQQGRIDPYVPSAFTNWAEAFDKLLGDGAASSAVTQARLRRSDEQNKQAFADFYGQVRDKVKELQTKLVPPLKLESPLREDINLALPQELGELKGELQRAFAAIAQRYHDLGVDPPPFGAVPNPDASLDDWNKALAVVGDADAFKALQAKLDGTTPQEWTPGTHAPGGTAIVHTIDGRRTLTHVITETNNADMDAPMIKAQDQLQNAEINLARCDDLIVRFKSNPSLIRDALVGELPSLPLDEIRHHLSEMRLALDRGDLKTFHAEAQTVLPLFQKFSDEMVAFAGKVEEKRADIEAAEQIVNMAVLAVSMAAAPFTGGGSLAVAFIVAPAVVTAGFEIVKADVTGEPVDGSAIAVSAVQGIIAAKVGKLLDPLLEAALQNPAVRQEVALFGKEAVKHALNNLLVGRINASVAAAARMAGTRGTLTGEQIRTIFAEELLNPEGMILDAATGVGGATFAAHVVALRNAARPSPPATRETATGPRPSGAAVAGTSTPAAPAREPGAAAKSNGTPAPARDTGNGAAAPAAPASGPRLKAAAPAAGGVPLGPDPSHGVDPQAKPANDATPPSEPHRQAVPQAALRNGTYDTDTVPGGASDGNQRGAPTSVAQPRPRAVNDPPGGSGRRSGAPGEAGGGPRGAPRPGANNADAAGTPRNADDAARPTPADSPTGSEGASAPHGPPLTPQQQRVYGRIVGTFEAMRNDISARIKRLEGTPQRWSTAGELLNQYKAEIETLKSRAVEATGDLREALLRATAKVQQDSEAFMQRPEFVLLGVEKGGVQNAVAAGSAAAPRRTAAIPPRVEANAIRFDCNNARDAVHEIISEKTGDWEVKAKAQRDEVGAKISEARSKAAQAALAGDTESAGLYARAAAEGERAFGDIEAALRAAGVEGTNVDHVQEVPGDGSAPEAHHEEDIQVIPEAEIQVVPDEDIHIVPDEDVHEAPGDDALLLDDDQILDILSDEPKTAGEASPPAAPMPHEGASSPTPHASSDPVEIAKAKTQAARDTRRALGQQLDEARKASSGYKKQFDDANAVRRFGTGDPAVARNSFQAAKNNYYLAEKNVAKLEAKYDLATRRLRYFERESAKAIHEQYPDLNAEQIQQALVDQMASADIASARQELNAKFGKTVDDSTQGVIKANEALKAVRAKRPVDQAELRAAEDAHQKAIDELAAIIRVRDDSPAGRALKKAEDLRTRVARARAKALEPGSDPMSGPDRPRGVPPSVPVIVLGEDPALQSLAKILRVPKAWADKGYQVVLVHGSPQGIAEMTREQFVKYIQANVEPGKPIVFVSCSLDGDLSVPLGATDHAQIPWAVSALNEGGHQVIAWTKTLTILPEARGPYPKGMIIALDPSAARPDIRNVYPTSIPNGKMITELGKNCWCVHDKNVVPTIREEKQNIPGDPGRGGQQLEIGGKKYRLKLYDIADPDKARRVHLPTSQYDAHQQSVAQETARSYEALAAKEPNEKVAKFYEAARDFYAAKENWYRAKQQGKLTPEVSKVVKDKLELMTQRLADFSQGVQDSAVKDPGNYQALADRLAQLTRVTAECASWQETPTPQHEAFVSVPRSSANPGRRGPSTVGSAPPSGSDTPPTADSRPPNQPPEGVAPNSRPSSRPAPNAAPTVPPPRRVAAPRGSGAREGTSFFNPEALQGNTPRAPRAVVDDEPTDPHFQLRFESAEAALKKSQQDLNNSLNGMGEAVLAGAPMPAAGRDTHGRPIPVSVAAQDGLARVVRNKQVHDVLAPAHEAAETARRNGEASDTVEEKQKAFKEAEKTADSIGMSAVPGLPANASELEKVKFIADYRQRLADTADIRAIEDRVNAARRNHEGPDAIARLEVELTEAKSIKDSADAWKKYYEALAESPQSPTKVNAAKHAVDNLRSHYELHSADYEEDNNGKVVRGYRIDSNLRSGILGLDIALAPALQGQHVGGILRDAAIQHFQGQQVKTIRGIWLDQEGSVNFNQVVKTLDDSWNPNMSGAEKRAAVLYAVRNTFTGSGADYAGYGISSVRWSDGGLTVGFERPGSGISLQQPTGAGRAPQQSRGSDGFAQPQELPPALALQLDAAVKQYEAFRVARDANSSNAPRASGSPIPSPSRDQVGAVDAEAAPRSQEIMQANIDIMKAGREGAISSSSFWEVANRESTHEGVKVRGLIDPKTGQILSIGVYADHDPKVQARFHSGELNEFIIAYDFGPGLTLKTSPYSLVPPDADHPLSATAQKELMAIVAWANSPVRPLGM